MISCIRGTGYSSPTEALLKNRLRTARLWTDDFYQLAKRFISENPFDDLGNFDKVNLSPNLVEYVPMDC